MSQQAGGRSSPGEWETLRDRPPSHAIRATRPPDAIRRPARCSRRNRRSRRAYGAHTARAGGTISIGRVILDDFGVLDVLEGVALLGEREARAHRREAHNLLKLQFVGLLYLHLRGRI